MKYEMIFGDERLFDGASEFVEVVRFNDYSREYLWGDLNTIQLLKFGELKAIPIVAMRTIIADPKRWTLEDKKAGRLPEVGSVFTHRNETLTCLFIDADGEIWAHDINNRIVTPSLRNCYPLETPEEKAVRLKGEWCARVRKICDTSRVTFVIADIHDAILSGDLPIPTKDGE